MAIYVRGPAYILPGTFEVGAATMVSVLWYIVSNLIQQFHSVFKDWHTSILTLVNNNTV